MAMTAEGVPIDLETVPVRVDNIHIQGLGRTKDDFVTQAVDDLFKANTFNEMVFKASEVQRRLEKLGCFRNVGIVIDTSKGENASDNGYEVKQLID